MSHPQTTRRTTPPGHLSGTSGLRRANACIKPLVNRDIGIPDSWFEVLLRLGRTPGHRMRMTDLADAVSFSSGGFTRLADRIERKG